MPPGRDSFRRNRVAPLSLYFTTQVHAERSRPTWHTLPRSATAWANLAWYSAPADFCWPGAHLTLLSLITCRSPVRPLFGPSFAFTLSGWLRKALVRKTPPQGFTAARSFGPSNG